MSSVSPLPPTIVAEGKGPGQALCAIIAAAAPRWGRGRVDRHRRRRGCRGFPAAGCRDFRPVRAEPALRGAPAARWYRAERKSVVYGQRVSVMVDLGGCRYITKYILLNNMRIIIHYILI